MYLTLYKKIKGTKKEGKSLLKLNFIMEIQLQTEILKYTFKVKVINSKKLNNKVNAWMGVLTS